MRVHAWTSTSCACKPARVKPAHVQLLVSFVSSYSRVNSFSCCNFLLLAFFGFSYCFFRLDLARAFFLSSGRSSPCQPQSSLHPPSTSSTLLSLLGYRYVGFLREGRKLQTGSTHLGMRQSCVTVSYFHNKSFRPKISFVIIQSRAGALQTTHTPRCLVDSMRCKSE